MTYGTSSYSELPYSTLPGRFFNLEVISDAVSSSESILTILRYKKLEAIGNRRNLIEVFLGVNGTGKGNIISATRFSDNRVNLKVAQSGIQRDAYVEDPGGIAVYKLIETEINV